jgi:hypothetical protein
MEKLLKNKWLMLLIGAVVLYFVWKKFGKGETVGAMGKVRPLRVHRDWCLCNEGWQTDCGGNCDTCCEGHGGVRPPYIK